MRALLVKLTSMGDVLHALPAITDAVRMRPGLEFDWVIDQHFAEIAAWHPAVHRTIVTAHRKWRKTWWHKDTYQQFKTFAKELRQTTYDQIVDGQNNLKSGLVMLLARGTRYGMDAKSSREWIAQYAHQHQYFVNNNLHAILRLRLLFAQVFGYDYVDTPADYGIGAHIFPEVPFDLPKPYIVLIHNASWQSKLWSETHWRELIQYAGRDGLQVVLPWGNVSEQQRALRISEGFSNAQVLPFCTLSQQARILLEARGAICGDTGLGHLAAALNVPSVMLYGATRQDLIGATGLNQHPVVSSFVCINCHRTTCYYQGRVHAEPLCMQAIQPAQVWSAFRET